MNVKPTVLAACCILAAALSAPSAQANTVVTFSTSLGSFDLSLNDAEAPITVVNFLSYVRSGAYTNTVFHRSVANFVIQGGGFYTDFSSVPASAPIVNEFSQSGLTNRRGTIAMARTNDPNSATSQWFINTVDNNTDLPGRTNLDKGPYAVFGEVLGNGMQVVDAIAALPIYDLSGFSNGAFTTVPLKDVGNAVAFSPDFWVTATISVVPEPQTWLTLGLGLVGIAAVARRSQRAA